MTAYRDDREALIARLEQLEAELERARAENARLRRGGDGEPADRSVWLGGPTHVVHERVIDGERPDEALEELVETLRFSLGQMGRSEKIGKTFAWQTEIDPQRGGRRVQVFVTRRGGTTRLRVEERMGALAGGLFGGVVGGAGIGGMATILGVTAGTGVLLPFGLAGAVMWAGLTYGVVRTSFAAVSRSRDRQLARLTDELAEVLRDAMPTAAPAVKARVETADEEEDEVSAEREAERSRERSR